MGIPTDLFLKSPDDSCKCDVCFDVFDEPMALKCGHTFCNGCIKKFQASTCPSCREEIESDGIGQLLAVRNYPVHGIIQGLELKCMSTVDSQHKCHWTGAFGDWAAHAKVCQFLVIRCDEPGCTHTCSRMDMVQHKADENLHVRLKMEHKCAEMDVKFEEHKRSIEATIQNLVSHYENESQAQRKRQRIELVAHDLTNFCRDWTMYQEHYSLDGFEHHPVKDDRKGVLENEILIGVPGPEQSPWVGGLYPFHMTFVDIDEPPICRVSPGIVHPNVNPDGKVDMTAIMSTKEWYKERGMSIPKILLAFQELLKNPKKSSKDKMENTLFYYDHDDYLCQAKKYAKKHRHGRFTSNCTKMLTATSDYDERNEEE